MKVRPPFRYAIALIIGLVIGIGATIIWSGNMILRDLDQSKSVELYNSRDLAFDAYQNQNVEIGIWALSNHISKINELREQRYVDEDSLMFHLLVTHARLAKLYIGPEYEEKRDYHISQALAIAESTDLKACEDLVSPESLWSYLDKIDARESH